MSFSYDKLWKKLIDENMNRTDLKLKIGLTSRTIAKMGKNENVSLDTIGKLCNYFQCDVGDIIEYKLEQKLEDVRR
ncbi:helix-turn-helix domain-containing protein [Hutsoniella sourekii]|uniref:helix-turn-helix domain-containing protein n=1 Tax=Hutsoniella sourekii TaxID=87650 RepID=UPI000480420A|nr:helix-turn-helix transcriptional regulator [Hutsoniella sourekii]